MRTGITYNVDRQEAVGLRLLPLLLYEIEPPIRGQAGRRFVFYLSLCLPVMKTRVRIVRKIMIIS